MTATETETDAAAHEGPDTHGHPTERQYVAVAMVLAAITAAEVGLYYISSIPDPALIALLCFAGFMKFVLVALWFMHLRFDSIIYRRLFVTGIVLATVVYLVYLTTLHTLRG